MAAGNKSRRFIRDEGGAVLPEVTAVFVLFMLVLLGIVEFTIAMYQWNAATKAAQWGARLAAVSDPVASNLGDASFDGVSLTGTTLPGDPMPGYDCTCVGATGSCTGSVPPGEMACSYSGNAMETLFFGRGHSGTCRLGDNGGMCQFLPTLQMSNIVVRYQNTGLGLAGRRPVPTITVSYTGLNYNFVFLDGLLDLVSISFPNRATVSVTAEDMRSNWAP